MHDTEKEKKTKHDSLCITHGEKNNGVHLRILSERFEHVHIIKCAARNSHYMWITYICNMPVASSYKTLFERVNWIWREKTIQNKQFQVKRSQKRIRLPCAFIIIILGSIRATDAEHIIWMDAIEAHNTMTTEYKILHIEIHFPMNHECESKITMCSAFYSICSTFT